MEEYYLLMRDLSNLEVWGKECCKANKDIQDKEKIKIRKKILKSY
jgi:hypothetical protein